MDLRNQLLFFFDKYLFDFKFKSKLLQLPKAKSVLLNYK